MKATMSSLTWMFQTAGFPDGESLARAEVVVTIYDDLLANVAACATVGRGGQAPRWHWATLVALEDAVMDESRPAYDRAYAWWLLVCTWGVLRFDDNRGVVPAEVKVAEGGCLNLDLTRTKTTGGGKGVEVRKVVVAAEAYLSRPGWLEAGAALWRRIAPGTRDYLLPLPDQGRESCILLEASYSDAAGMMRALMASLELPGTGEPLPSVLARVYTPHSPRSWLPSAAAALGY